MRELFYSIRETMDAIGLPYQVIFCIIAIIFASDFIKGILAYIETFLEDKKGKQIKFFDHTKIVIVFICSLIAALTLWGLHVIRGVEVFLYSLALCGVSCILYDVVIKKLKQKIEDL